MNNSGYLRPYRSRYLQGIVDIWNATFVDHPNYVRISRDDLLRRVIKQPAFSKSSLLVAFQGRQLVGFVHFGRRFDLSSGMEKPIQDASEGHIFALVAPEEDLEINKQLLDAALAHLSRQGAHRVLLYPNWAHGCQPFYNGIAGAYETPGLALSRTSLIKIAVAYDFSSIAYCDSPELDLRNAAHIEALLGEGTRLWSQGKEWGLEQHNRSLDTTVFPERRVVELVRGSQIIATTAYGPWREYEREYGKRLFGITGVRVAPVWRGKGLGKLTLIRAMEAALKAGAERLHLHVSQDNQVAWNLYHKAIGFEPKYSWMTLARIKK